MSGSFPERGASPATMASGTARPSDRRVLWLIARRGALESLRDRMTLGFNLFFVFVFPLGIVLAVVRAQVGTLIAADRGDAVGTVLAIFCLSVGLTPATGAVGIASGQFAGEKEQGNLAPLLASPASNFAIFGGKILGSVLPAMGFVLVAEAVYFTSLALVGGVGTLRLVPVRLSLLLLSLVPPVDIFAATVASLISSRVRTYSAAQQISGLVLVPFWGGIVVLLTRFQDGGLPFLLVALAALVVIDAALIALAASTWRREEVLAQR